MFLCPDLPSIVICNRKSVVLNAGKFTSEGISAHLGNVASTGK